MLLSFKRILSSFYNKVLYLEEAVVEAVVVDIVVDKVGDKVVETYIIKRLQ